MLIIWRQGSIILHCFPIFVMLCHVLHVTNANSSLASLQLFALPCLEGGLCENKCCGVVQEHEESIENLGSGL